MSQSTRFQVYSFKSRLLTVLGFFGICFVAVLGRVFFLQIIKADYYIQKAKEGRVIMLTSHSMEEADVLGDKIGIMSHGHMQALGTPLELKERYGKGMVVTIIIQESASLNKIVHFMN